MVAREELIRNVGKFTLFDDVFMNAVFANIEACQYVVRLLPNEFEIQGVIMPISSIFCKFLLRILKRRCRKCVISVKAFMMMAA